jgi:hypothetical protein
MNSPPLLRGRAVSQKPKKQKRELPPPLVHFWRHPIRYMEIVVLLVIVGLMGTHIGTLDVVGLYYLLFQTTHAVKHFWDTLLTEQWAHLFGSQLFSTAHWNSYRHLVRNVGEGVLGGTLAQLLIFNRYRLKRSDELNWLDKIEFKLHIPNVKDHRGLKGGQLVALPLLVVIYAIPGFFVGYLVTKGLKHGLTLAHNDYVFFFGNAKSGHSAWSHIQTLWTGNKDQKIIGLFASVFLARRVMKGVADDLQGYFVARRRASGKGMPFYWPPNVRARFNGMSPEGVAAIHTKTGSTVPLLLTTAILTSIALAGYGYWVLATKT